MTRSNTTESDCPIRISKEGAEAENDKQSKPLPMVVAHFPAIYGWLAGLATLVIMGIASTIAYMVIENRDVATANSTNIESIVKTLEYNASFHTTARFDEAKFAKNIIPIKEDVSGLETKVGVIEDQINKQGAEIRDLLIEIAGQIGEIKGQMKGGAR